MKKEIRVKSLWFELTLFSMGRKQDHQIIKVHKSLSSLIVLRVDPHRQDVLLVLTCFVFNVLLLPVSFFWLERISWCWFMWFFFGCRGVGSTAIAAQISSSCWRQASLSVRQGWPWGASQHQSKPDMARERSEAWAIAIHWIFFSKVISKVITGKRKSEHADWTLAAGSCSRFSLVSGLLARVGHVLVSTFEVVSQDIFFALKHAHHNGAVLWTNIWKLMNSLAQQDLPRKRLEHLWSLEVCFDHENHINVRPQWPVIFWPTLGWLWQWHKGFKVVTPLSLPRCC